MGTITINGQTFTGNNVSVKNYNGDMAGGRIIIDGVDVTEQAGNVISNNRITLVLEGDINVVETTQSVVVNGNVLRDVKSRGSVTCGDVHGDVDADGSTQVGGNVGGSIDAGGSVNVGGSVTGKIEAGGSVNVGRR